MNGSRLRTRARFKAAVLYGIAAAGALACHDAFADVIVVANRTSKQVEFRAIEDPPAVAFLLDAGEAVSLRVDGDLSIEFSADGLDRCYALAVNSAYFFYIEKGSNRLDLRRIGLGDMEGADVIARPASRMEAKSAARLSSPDWPRRAARSDLLTIRVKLLVDEEERASRPRWEERLRRRLTRASGFYERAAGVRFAVAAIDVWKSDDHLTDFEGSLRDFERKVKAEPVELAIGFTSQYEIPAGRTMLGGTHGPLASHILIREWSQHVSEPERLEILIHELGHFLGAAHSPERDSVMRPSLGDRQALSQRFHVCLDPLNLLAIGLVADSMREKRAPGAAQAADSNRRRLADIYRVLAAALPDDPAAGEYLRQVLPLNERPAPSDDASAAANPAAEGAEEIDYFRLRSPAKGRHRSLSSPDAGPRPGR